MFKQTSLYIALLANALCGATSPALAGDADAGERVFNRCAACHSFDPNARRMGAHLQGIMGREAGSVVGARYSKAMRESGIIWSEETLDGYLANPRAYLPGTSMSVSVGNDEDRANLIAYLARES